MRKLFFLLVMLASGFIFSQEDSLVVRKVKIKKKLIEADFFPRLAGHLSGEISFKEIKEKPELFTNSYVDISSFSMSLRIGNGEEVFHSKSKHLTSVMLDKLSNLKKGEPILFTNIKGKTDKVNGLKLQPLMLLMR